MPSETTSGAPNPEATRGVSKSITELFSEHSPKLPERLNVEISSRVHLDCLINTENISKIILQDMKKKNGYVFNGIYEISLIYRDGITLKPPGSWRHCLSEASGESLPELLAHIKSIRLCEAEQLLASKLMINEQDAFQHWKSAGWQWDELPLYSIASPTGLGAPDMEWIQYSSKTNVAALIAQRSFIGDAWVIEYFSRWHRNKASRAHWVRALPPGKLPLFTIHRNRSSPENTISIVSTEFDGRFSLDPSKHLIAAIPGGAGNFKRTDLTLLAGRSVYLELLPDEVQFATQIEDALNKSKADKVDIKIIGRSGPDFPLSDLRQIASEYGVKLPSQVISAPQLSSAGLISAGEPLQLTGSKRPQILEPIMREAGLLWLYGPEKLGKTWLALTLAHVIATGGSFGPWRAPKPRKVLFIDGEMHPDDLHSAIRSVSKGKGHGEIMVFSVLCARNTVSGRINLLDIEWREKIYKMVRSSDIIIFDNFSSLTNNKPSDFFVIYDFIRRLQAKNVGVIMVDHTNNKGNLQGPEDKKRISEAFVQIQIPKGRHSGEECRLIEVIKLPHETSEAPKAFIGKMIFGADTFSFEIERTEISEGSEAPLKKIGELALIVIARDEDKLPFRELFPKLGIRKSTASDRYKKAKSLTGSYKEALDQEIQRLLEERKTIKDTSGYW